MVRNWKKGEKQKKRDELKQLLRPNKLDSEQSKKTIQYADLSQRVSPPRIRRGRF